MIKHLKDLPQRIVSAIKGFGFKQWFLLILNIVLAVGSVGCVLGLNHVSSALTALHAAEWFRGDSGSRYAQLACYLPVDQGQTEEGIFNFRRQLDSRIEEQGMEAPEGGRIYIDAYNGVEKVTISSGNGDNVSVKAIGVGGDFFYFHPYLLHSGSYINSSNLMDDLVVLDEETAWRLFGGMNLTGMTVFINGESFLVSGVIVRENDFASTEAYTGDGGVFMSFSAMQRLKESASITGYEIIMPDPITNFAKGVVEDIFPLEDGDIVENSSRYTLGHLLEVIRSFGKRSMRTNGVIYPYWENAARLTEDYAALLLLLAVLLAVCPVMFVLVLTIREVRRIYRLVKVKVPEKVEAVVEKRKEERLERQYQKKNEGK